MPLNPSYQTMDFQGYNVINIEGLKFDSNATIGNVITDNMLVLNDLTIDGSTIQLIDSGNFSIIDNELYGMGLKNSSLGVETFFTSTPLHGQLGTSTDDDLVFKTDDTFRMIITNDGNVGIGNVNPVDSLSVEGNIYSNNIVSLTSSVVNLTGNVSQLQTRMNQVEGNVNILKGNVSSLTTRVAGTEANIDLLFLLEGDLDGNISSLTTRLANVETEINTGNLSTLKLSNGNTFISSGNFGLGTNTPTEKLQVVGNGSFTGNVSTSNLITPLITTNQTLSSLVLGSSTTQQNKLQINASTSIDRILRFRRGGGAPLGFSGIQFSEFDTHSYYQGTVGNSLYFTYIPGNPTETGNVGNPIMTLTTTGNVGIGTSSPEFKLQVNGNINITGDYLINGSPIASKWITSGNNIYNSNTGNVGIGTTNPIYNLEIPATSTINPIISLTNPTNNRLSAGIGFTGADLFLYIGDSGTNGIPLNNLHRRFRLTDEGNVAIGRTSIGDLPNTTEALVVGGGAVFGNGNVSIGKFTTPTATLDVAGSGTFSGLVDSNQTPDLVNGENYYRLLNEGFLRWGIGLQTTETGGNTGSNLNFFSYDNSGIFITQAMTLQRDGNVGIGTSSPQAKLDVNGNSRFSGNISFPTLNTRIDAGGLNDLNAFVFDGSRGQLINSTSNIYFNMDTNNSDTSRVIQFATNRSSSTGGTTIMTMTEDGNVGIGTSSPNFKLQVTGTNTPMINMSSFSLDLQLVPSSTFLLIGGDGLTTIDIADDGDIRNQNNSYGSLSDIRLKENITPANSQIEDFKKYNFVNYNLIGRDTQGKKHLGLIAQEVLDISPGIVNYDEDRDEYSIMYSILYLKACKCIQELIEKVEQLECLVKTRLES